MNENAVCKACRSGRLCKREVAQRTLSMKVLRSGSKGFRLCFVKDLDISIIMQPE